MPLEMIAAGAEAEVWMVSVSRQDVSVRLVSYLTNNNVTFERRLEARRDTEILLH